MLVSTQQPNKTQRRQSASLLLDLSTPSAAGEDSAIPQMTEDLLDELLSAPLSESERGHNGSLMITFDQLCSQAELSEAIDFINNRSHTYCNYVPPKNRERQALAKRKFRAFKTELGRMERSGDSTYAELAVIGRTVLERLSKCKRGSKRCGQIACPRCSMKNFREAALHSAKVITAHQKQRGTNTALCIGIGSKSWIGDSREVQKNMELAMSIIHNAFAREVEFISGAEFYIDANVCETNKPTPVRSHVGVKGESELEQAARELGAVNAPIHGHIHGTVLVPHSKISGVTLEMIISRLRCHVASLTGQTIEVWVEPIQNHYRRAKITGRNGQQFSVPVSTPTVSSACKWTMYSSKLITGGKKTNAAEIRTLQRAFVNARLRYTCGCFCEKSKSDFEAVVSNCQGSISAHAGLSDYISQQDLPEQEARSLRILNQRCQTLLQQEKDYQVREQRSEAKRQKNRQAKLKDIRSRFQGEKYLNEKAIYEERALLRFNQFSAKRLADQAASQRRQDDYRRCFSWLVVGLRNGMSNESQIKSRDGLAMLMLHDSRKVEEAGPANLIIASVALWSMITEYRNELEEINSAIQEATDNPNLESVPERFFLIQSQIQTFLSGIDMQFPALDRSGEFDRERHFISRWIEKLLIITGSV